MTNPSSTFTRKIRYVTIPIEIWEMEEISILEKHLLIEIWYLHDDDKGGCFASDEYLCDFLKIKKSRLHEMLKNLKKLGLIETFSNGGRGAIRKALISTILGIDRKPDFRKTGSHDSGKPEVTIPVFRNPTYIDNSLDNSIDKRIGLAPSHVCSDFSSNENSSNNNQSNITDIIRTQPVKIQGDIEKKKIKYGEYVEYTQEEYDQLIKDFSKHEVDQAISEIEDWYPDRDKKKCRWGSGFYRGTRRWIRTMREKNSKLGKVPAYKTNLLQAQKNKQDATKINLKYYSDKCNIYLMEDAIKFLDNNPYKVVENVIKFDEHGFVDKMKNLLIKYNFKPLESMRTA